MIVEFLRNAVNSEVHRLPRPVLALVVAVAQDKSESMRLIEADLY